jgi:hypothetical protein
LSAQTVDAAAGVAGAAAEAPAGRSEAASTGAMARVAQFIARALAEN